ncbi:hypothetical protein RIE95_01240 [Acidithiobacillus thiooxidans]|jgi:hypothetical protein|uniref:hypothetical protein n=1 Tax=Acidithiobacillus thiooxidans TaxID=930 RepID=UPI00285A99B4|nr:hypothetical protein [Acidithiobacillus thiooxidans]MDR7925634.1 hypothetical protein [Acidithiobacillus thiooxidans]
MHSEYLKFIKQAFVLSSGAMAGILTDRYMGVIHEYGSVLGCLILLEAKGEGVSRDIHAAIAAGEFL